MMSPVAAMIVPLIPGWNALRPFAAELWIIVTMVAVLVTPFFVRRSNSACGIVTLLGLLGALVSLLILRPVTSDPRHGLGHMLVTDGPAFYWKVLLLLFVAGVVLMWFATIASTFHDGDGPEFFTLLLGATLGMALMGSASNLLMIFIAVEMASLPSYVLAGFRKTHRVGAEASLKYVLFGATTSAIMVYGLSLLYGFYGTLNLYASLGADGSHVAGIAEQIASQGTLSPLLLVGLLGFVIGIGFKIAAVPFHFWCPDVFEGAGIDVTTFLSVASKGAGLILLMRVVTAIAAASGYRATGVTIAVASILGVLGAITCTVGNTGAYAQTNLKRLLAYSSIAQAGYMLCASSMLFIGFRASPSLHDPGVASVQVVLLYLSVYVFMNLGAFTVAGVVAEKSGEDLPGFRGLGRRSPLLAASMFACLVSLIGLPPFAGFAAKLNLLYLLFLNGPWWRILAIVIFLNTIISAFYYFRIVREMYLKPPEAKAPPNNSLGLCISVVCGMSLLMMFIGFNFLIRVTTEYSRFVNSP